MLGQNSDNFLILSILSTVLTVMLVGSKALHSNTCNRDSIMPLETRASPPGEEGGERGEGGGGGGERRRGEGGGGRREGRREGEGRGARREEAGRVETPRTRILTLGTYFTFCTLRFISSARIGQQ